MGSGSSTSSRSEGSRLRCWVCATRASRRGAEGWRTLRKHSTGACATIGSSVVAGAAAEANTRAASGRAVRVAAAAVAGASGASLLLLLLRVKFLFRQASAAGREVRKTCEIRRPQAANKSAAKCRLAAAACKLAAPPPPLVAPGLAQAQCARHNSPPCLSWKQGGAGRPCLQWSGQGQQEAGPHG